MKHYLLFTLLISISSYAQKKPAVIAKKIVNPVMTVSEPGIEAGSTGKVSFTYQGKRVTYTTVRAKDGNIWLQQNLGSERVATKSKDERAYGDLFQWGRWDDGHQLVVEPANTRRATASPNNPDALDKAGPNPFYYMVYNQWWDEGSDRDSWKAATPKEATAINGCDPCKAIGAGWHLPTKDEAAKAWKLEYITDANGGILSNLKLPNAGYREVMFGTTKFSRDDKGAFWTATPASNKAYYMDMYPEAMKRERGMGLSVRCMKSANFTAATLQPGKDGKNESMVATTDLPYFFDKGKKSYKPLSNAKGVLEIKQKAGGFGGREFTMNLLAQEEFTTLPQADSLSFYIKPSTTTKTISLHKVEMIDQAWKAIAFVQRLGSKAPSPVNNIALKITPAPDGLFKVTVPTKLSQGNYCFVTAYDTVEKTAELYTFKID